MGDLVAGLNDNAGAIQVVFSALVTLATVVYALLTWVLVSETRRMRKAQTDAKVTVSVESRPQHFGFVDIVVRNEGVGPAYDVHFGVQPLAAGAGDQSLVDTISELGFIQKGVGYFSPNQEFRSFLASLRENHELKMETTITVDVSYRTAAGEEVKDRYDLDFSVFRNMVQLGKPDLYSIAQSVEKVQKDVHHLTTGWKRLEVITQDKAALREERRLDRLERIEARELERLSKQEAETGET